jgi:hypothetical protein
MTKKRSKSTTSRSPLNARRSRTSLAEVLASANRRAHEKANRPAGKRQLKSVRAAIAATAPDAGADAAGWTRRMMRWLLALALMPILWVTMWTFLSRFSHAAVHQGFWQTTEFWYFATGALLMAGWFCSGYLRTAFLYLYVLGHELTHAIFVIFFRGRVTDFHVSAEGGYITTNKSNMVIALSPYFVPFWSIIVVIFHLALRHLGGVSADWDRWLHAALGVTWTFHMIWTLWMIPRDQPDLKENGTFLSLVVISLANLLVLVALLCAADASPWRSVVDFSREWLRHAATWGDVFLRHCEGWLVRLLESARI